MIPFLPEVGWEFSKEIQRKISDSFSQVKAPLQTRAVKRRVGGDASLRPSTSADELYGAANGGRRTRKMEKLSFVPSAVSEPRWAVHMCDKECRANGLKFLGNCGLCGRRRRCSPYDKLVQKVLQRRAIEARRRTCGGFKLEGTGRAEGLSREVMGSFGTEHVMRKMWERFTLKKG